MFKRVILVCGILLLGTTAVLATDVISVSSVLTSTSEILTDEEITAITNQIEGRSVALDEIQRVVDEINSLYAEKNFITARAIFLSDEIDDGVVHIQLVEGRVGEYIVQNNESTKTPYFTKRLSLRPGDLVRLDTLEQDIFYFNKTNDVQMTAQLKAGSEFGETDCVLSVTEPPRYPVSVYSDNGGRQETGLHRLGMSVTDNSFFGLRDTLTLSGVFAQGSVGVSTVYDKPIGARGSRVSLSYDYSETNIISGPFKSVDISGFSSSLGITASKPFLVEPQFSQFGSLEWRTSRAQNYFSGATLKDTELEYQKVTASIGTQSATDTQVIFVQQELTAGVVESPERDDFVKYAASLTLQRLLSDGLILTCRGNYQLTPDKLLPSGDGFSIGGMSSVRGYSEGALSGDQGYFVSMELSQQVSPRTTAMVFVDHGGAFPFKGNDEPVASTDYAISVGFGTIINFTDFVAGKFVVGFPVRQERSPQLHLLIQASL